MMKPRGLISSRGKYPKVSSFLHENFNLEAIEYMRKQGCVKPHLVDFVYWVNEIYKETA